MQVKVKIRNPDELLRPDMNASVAFLADEKPAAASEAEKPQKPVVYVPASAIRDGAVFLLVDGVAVRRAVKTGPAGPQGTRIGGEDVINTPPQDLKDGMKVKAKS